MDFGHDFALMVIVPGMVVATVAVAGRLTHVRDGYDGGSVHCGAVEYQFAVIVGIQRNPDFMLSRCEVGDVVIRFECSPQFFAVHVDMGVARTRCMRLVHRFGREPEPHRGDVDVDATVRVGIRSDRYADWNL